MRCSPSLSTVSLFNSLSNKYVLFVTFWAYTTAHVPAAHRGATAHVLHGLGLGRLASAEGAELKEEHGSEQAGHEEAEEED